MVQVENPRPRNLILQYQQQQLYRLILRRPPYCLLNPIRQICRPTAQLLVLQLQKQRTKVWLLWHNDLRLFAIRHVLNRLLRNSLKRSLLAEMTGKRRIHCWPWYFLFQVLFLKNDINWFSWVSLDCNRLVVDVFDGIVDFPWTFQNIDQIIRIVFVKVWLLASTEK